VTQYLYLVLNYSIKEVKWFTSQYGDIFTLNWKHNVIPVQVNGSKLIHVTLLQILTNGIPNKLCNVFMTDKGSYHNHKEKQQ